MKPESNSYSLLGITRSKAKMYEYRVPIEHHIEITREPAQLFSISIGLLGDLANKINSGRLGKDAAVGSVSDLRFSAQFFDSYLNGRFDRSLNEYLLIVGAAAYYLSDLPGSASVLTKMLPEEAQDLHCSKLDHFVTWLLKGTFQEYTVPEGSAYRREITAIAKWMTQYYRTGRNEERLDELANALCGAVHDGGSPREVLFADVSAAIARKRREYSAWFSLPRYSGQPVDAWRQAIQKETFVRELWPAQRLLGENRVFQGRSGVVQMPTSAGKTRATELIIRSEFLADRAKLAVVVAPFRALCHEIRNSLVEAFRGEAVKVDELTEVFQRDFELDSFLTGRQVLVVTPEKLVYVLRHNTELANSIGLLIYDEGHQFDNGSRGVTYELLVTSLKSLIPRRVQTILISAVISNAAAINEWLNGPNSVVVSGSALSPTFRSIAFASWTRRLGRLQFVSEGNLESKEFFVPRIIEAFELERKARERKARVFPIKGDGPDIALYLGLKLSPSGSVAIFCGTKPTVTNLCQRAVDVFDRKATLDRPIEQANAAEIERLAILHSKNLGEVAPTAQSARLGVFAHHGNTPHGIRLAVEHAMRRGEARMVICTSTLAQGVNLPIRYLIVSSTQQGAERIKVRDFHNLIGRAGRSGMHTEGSIVFANSEIYDGREASTSSARWSEIKELFQPDNAEPCVSTLLTVFKPLLSDDEKFQIVMKPADLLKACMGRQSDFDNFASRVVQRNAAQQFSKAGLLRQIEEKRRIVTAIESYLMAYWEETTESERVESLAEHTLAYHLADGNATEQLQLVDLFKTIAANIALRVPDTSRRRMFARTLLGLRDVIALERWVAKHADDLSESSTDTALLENIWPNLTRHIQNATFQRCTAPGVLLTLAKGWINGDAFSELLGVLVDHNVRFGLGSRPRLPTIDHVVDICENAFGFDGMLLVGAVAEIFEYLRPTDAATAERLRHLQKRVKYGLRTTEQMLVYELGFADRVIATELAEFVTGAQSPGEVRTRMQYQRDKASAATRTYPSYYREIMSRLVR